MSYCTIEDLRSEGFTEEDFTDEALALLIEQSGKLIDKITGQFFEPRTMTIRLDGRGGQNLLLPLFLIGDEIIKVDNEVLNQDEYILYNRFYPDDDRHYPKIYRAKKWPAGKLNIEITGNFGYVEEDLSTPKDIKRAAMKLAVSYFPLLSDKTAQEEKALQGLVISETTDGHSYSLSAEALTNIQSGALTGDSEVDAILRTYTRPKLRFAVA